MPRVVFASAIARWRSAQPDINVGEWSVAVGGATLREVLAAAFDQDAKLRGYVLDERGALRHHVVAFINGEPARDKLNLSEPVPTDGEVYIFQALSGGL